MSLFQILVATSIPSTTDLVCTCNESIHDKLVAAAGSTYPVYKYFQ